MLYVNKTICLAKLKQWTQVKENSETAIRLDGNSIKAHVYYGESCIHLSLFDEAVTYLEKGN